MSIKTEHALSHATAMLVAAGVPEKNAALTARAIVASDVWGNPSHGLMRLPFYLQRITMGGVNAGANLNIISERGAITSIDGEDGLGHWQVWEAAQLGVSKAKEFGISLVSVKNSSHCGALGVYLYPALDAGQISMIFTNGPAVMPAVGGNAPLLSTSPIASGIPSNPPMIIDLSTSAVARGKIANAAKAGGSIPEGWAVNAKGEPITDAKEALMGMLAPLGGAKGFALGLMVESLSAGLSGGALSREVPDMFNPDDDTKPQAISHTVITIDPNDLGDSASYDDFNKLASSITQTGGRVPGSRRLHPNKLGSGEINIAEPVLKDLDAWSEKLGLANFS
ncbi:MAG: Ldh family oxidoreductase [Candidatus Nanopelagicaceae bacterium]|nr:Ldh family oxidoreductase [Candidatus Nanopelagicaceae bacterium]